MIGNTTAQRRLVGGASVLLGIAGLVWGGSAWFAEPFVRGIYEGDFLPYFGKLIRIHATNNPSHQGIGFYVRLIEGAAQRLFVVSVVFWGIVVALVRWRPSILVDYFSEEGSPLTLALFRIVVFGLMLEAINVPHIVESAAKASEVFYAPPLMGWFYGNVPLGEPWVRGAARLMQVSCVFALVGFFTRSAAWIAGGLGIYVLGIPELLGKINHGYHHVIWFALLLGAAPSGDALSVDALLRAWRCPESEDTVRPSASARYGRPLRWAWLLIAVIYFFAGFWKVMLSGTEWMLSENLKFKMYANWHKLGFIPTLRIDRVPLIYQSLAVFTVGFELFFGVVLLFRRVRPLAVLSGLSFHLGTAYFMRIFFTSLMWCYVMFVPWGTTLRRIGRTFFPDPVTVRCGASTSSVGRLVAVVRSGDWFEALDYQEDDRLAANALRVEGADQTWTGWAALGQLVLRVPLLWPLAPILGLGFALPLSLGEHRPRARSSPDTRQVVTLTGAGLLGINVLFGLFLINSFPFSVYPTHAGVAGRYITDVDMLISTASRDTLKAESILDLAPSRRRGLMRQVLSAPDSASQARQLRRIASLLNDRIPDSIEAEEVLIYREKISKVPEQWENNPVERSLVTTIPLNRPVSRSEKAAVLHSRRRTYVEGGRSVTWQR